MVGFWLFSQPSENETAQPTICGCPAKKFWIILALVVLALVLVAVLVAVLCILLIPSNEDLETGEKLKKKMNLAVDPCSDFHEYACGGWLSSDGVKNSDVPVSFVKSMQDNMKSQILDLLKMPVNKRDPIYKVKPREFFQACNNVERLKERGKTPFLDFLKEFGKLPVVNEDKDDSSFSEDDYDITPLVTKLAPLGSVCFFTIHTDGDMYDDWSGLYFRQLPYETTDSNQKDVETWFRAVLEQLEFNPNKADFENLRNFENRIMCEMSKNNTAEKNLLHTVDDVKKKTSWMDFRLFYTDIIKSATEGLPNAVENRIRVENIELFKGPSSILSESSVSVKSNMPLCVVRELLKFTSALYPGFPPFPIGDKVMGMSLSKTYTREERCVTETMALLPELVHRLYFEEFKPEKSTLSFVWDMIKVQQIQYGIHVDNSRQLYLGENQSKKKVESLSPAVGYPAVLRDVEDKYATIPTDEYFEAVVALVRFRFNNDIVNVFCGNTQFWKWTYPWKHYTRLISKGIEDFGPYAINKEYLAVPAEILQIPVFDSNWRSSMKFGALGSLLGSQIFKVASQMENSLPAHVRDCYLQVFNLKLFQNHQINESANSLKVDQFLWDTAGIELSCLAYKKFQEGKEEERPLPGLDFTQTQLLFISYAQMMCEKIPEKYTALTLSRPQMPFQFRVNENLCNSASFRKAFGCKNDTILSHCPRY